ncbi:MAG: ATP-binding protein [bacterium]|nr:ATP-binding protein [bacterium]
MSATTEYGFMQALGRAVKAGTSRVIALTGNVSDLFALPREGEVPLDVPLLDYLAKRFDVGTWVPVVYSLNDAIRFVQKDDQQRFTEAWVRFQTGRTTNELAIQRFLRAHAESEDAADLVATAEEFTKALEEAKGNATLALELLRWMCVASRATVGGTRIFSGNLVIIIEDADLLTPAADPAHLSEGNLRRIAICRDWFGDLGFMEGPDTVILLTESRSALNERIAKLPQLLDIAIPAPSAVERQAYIERFIAARPVQLWENVPALAHATAGLTIHALRQLLVDAAYDNAMLTLQLVTRQVERFIIGQLGEGTVEFSRPEHTLADLVGNQALIAFIQEKLVPRLRRTDRYALPGAAIPGSIGAGKTYIFEAVAGEIGCPVLLLKNLRSKWYGGTDIIFERLRRVVEALAKVVVFVDEADTQFGGVGADTHETERRLTGKLQAMMSDTKLRGKVHWMLMTARIHLLSADIRRPGRVGNLIIPVFDPAGDDFEAFLRWAISIACTPEQLSSATREKLRAAVSGYSAAAFAALREELAAVAHGGTLSAEQILAIVSDIVPANIGSERRYQELHAVLNCTRKSLWPAWYTDANREECLHELRMLEASGIR